MSEFLVSEKVLSLARCNQNGVEGKVFRDEVKGQSVA